MINQTNLMYSKYLCSCIYLYICIHYCSIRVECLSIENWINVCICKWISTQTNKQKYDKDGHNYKVVAISNSCKSKSSRSVLNFKVM